jgi:dipeptidyl aminopeptidase/acylaminoacyl peptidase
MTTDMVLERIRAANLVQTRQADNEMLFRAIVSTPGDSRLTRERHRLTGMRLAFVALVVFLVLAATATATYFALRSSDTITFPQGGSIVSVAGTGATKRHPVWHCPGGADWCGEIAGIAWSPDGERLALSLWELGANSSYVGFHLIDPRTGTDRHIPAKDMVPRFGCVALSYLTWSPNGKLLAYTCRGILDPGDTGIYTIRPDGTGHRLIATGPFPAYSPTWSPDGKRLAFSTGESPLQRPVGESIGPISYRSVIYVIDLAGRHARRIATGALPDWSPDGKTIAYFASGCEGIPNDTGRIRLVTPTGRDVTPPTAPCDGIGPARHPIPAWSPDGRQIAVATNRALYLMNANGTGLRQLRQGGPVGGVTGYLRPAWRPK